MASASSADNWRKSRRNHERPPNSRPLKTVNPRALRASVPPPQTLLLYPPVLPEDAKARLTAPTRSRTEEIHKFFDVSTHVIPAAYPRLTPFVPFSDLERKAGDFAGSETKQSRIARANQVAEQLMQLRDDYSEGRLPSDGSENRLLWNVTNRYARRDTITGNVSNRKKVTLLLAHANGFPKETWEPFLVHLCLKLENCDDVFVDEAWAIEAVQHGDSGLINYDKLGVLFDWSEHARDLLNFLLNYMPDRSSSASSLPVHLPRIPEGTSHKRSDSGFSDRTLIAIGHSFGGCTSTLAAVSAPRLFSSVVLVDPVIVAEYIDRKPHVLHLIQGALQRRENWSSREEALRLFQSSPFFKAWDPKVLDVYVNRGLVTVRNNGNNMGAQLKMSGLQEAVVFADVQVSYETYELLESLRDEVDLLWIMGATGSGVTLPEDERDLVWRRPTNSENVCVASSGHLIAQEAPTELAHEVSVFLRAKFAQGAVVGKCRL